VKANHFLFKRESQATASTSFRASVALANPQA
jgi:hypothetical protein